MIGRVNASIWTLNPRRAISHGVSVVPILAPKTIPIPCSKVKIPAPINPSIIIVTTLLLWRIAVAVIPIPILLSREFAYFCMVCLIDCQKAIWIVSSNNIIPKRKRAIPPISMARGAKYMSMMEKLKVQSSVIWLYWFALFCQKYSCISTINH